MKILSNIDFRRQVAMSYILRFGNESKASGRKSQVPAENKIRFDNIGHLIQLIPSKKRRRCQGDLCKSVISTECVKCNVGLCTSCFLSYHKNN